MLISPPFSWAGCKLDILQHLLKIIPKTNRFIDVFGGSGVVLINMPKQDFEVLNDINSYIANFYRVLQDKEKKEELVHKLENIVYSRELFDHFKIEKTKHNINDVEKAFAWYYCLRTSFAQLGRNYGRSLIGGKESTRLWDRLPAFEHIHFRLRTVFIENRDCFQLLKEYDTVDTTFYIDPPYINTTYGTYKYNFTGAEHEKLLETIFSLKAACVVSGEPDDKYESMPWSKSFKFPVKGKINNEDSRKGRVECVWVKNA